MLPEIPESWKTVLREELVKDYFKQFSVEVQADYLVEDPPIYPPAALVFDAFKLCPFEEVRVVILGQDPYHGHGQAMGLSFSVPDGVRIPPSLRNIYKEIQSDIGAAPATNGDLTAWAKQGVLLLNSTLTVAHKQSGSHQGRGWETFTDSVIKKISDEHEHVVFLLWGAYARKKSDLIDDSKHLVLNATHPSPLSAHRGFLGCKHFSLCNNYLKLNGHKEINW